MICERKNGEKEMLIMMLLNDLFLSLLVSQRIRWRAYKHQTTYRITSVISGLWYIGPNVCVCVCAVWYILFFSHSKSAHMRTCTRKRFRKRQKLRSLRSEYLNLTFAHTHPMEFTGNNQFSALCLFIDSFTRRYIVNEKLDERRFFCEEYFLYLFRFRCLSNWHSC